MVSFSMLQVGSIMSSVNLMMSPVCRKFPGLKFVFSEGGIGWLPNAIERADRMWLRHKIYSGLDDTLPSEIYRQNMYLCMIEEPVCLKYRDDIGVDHIMWECDYPHTDTTWPDSQSTTEEVLKLADVTDEEADLITHGNAERVFRWKMADPAVVAPGARRLMRLVVDAASAQDTDAATRSLPTCSKQTTKASSPPAARRSTFLRR